MAPRVYATLGRAADNDVILDDPTVSNHHARLSWASASLWVEDLSSANGTFVDGQRVKSARMRPGADLRVGQVVVPWSHEGLRALLKSGVGARTLVLPKVSTYVCAACGKLGQLPPGPPPALLTCESCGTTLRTGTKPGGGYGAWAIAGMFVLGVGLSGALYTWLSRTSVLSAVVSETLPLNNASTPTQAEQRIGGHTAELIAKAFTPMDALTRNTAVRIAARSEGPFHVEQVAEIWSTVRKGWRYVNDPDGQEYFATATETIQNGYVGDCDDFAITLASMVGAIGGKARVVLMDGPQGGHAYAEACVQGEPSSVAATLTKHYRTRWKSYLKSGVPSSIAYRASAACPIWLNLDWNSIVPGGAYEPEAWAVAIYPDGHSETLTAAPPPPSSPATPKRGVSSSAPDAQ